MNAAQILQILLAVMGAAPKLLELYQQAVSGTAVSAADIDAALESYGGNRAVFAAKIAAAEAAGK